MIRPSPEIQAIVRRWAERIVRHEVEDLPYMLSESEALTYVGSSKGEIWQGQVLRDGISAHLAEVPDISETDVRIEAWESGDTGWALYTCRFHVQSTGVSGEHRATFVFVLERGGWKMVQHHLSQPDSNAEKLGIEHKAMAALIEAARNGAPLEQTEGMASVMFTDIVGSTALAAAMGDRHWHETVGAHFSMLRGIVNDHGGQFVKSLGDGTMSSFPSARRALESALAIRGALAADRREPALAVRIGLHTGDVIQAEDDFFGNVVNKAARIAALAGAGEILLSDATCLMAGPESFPFDGPRNVALAGLGEGHVIYALP